MCELDTHKKTGFWNYILETLILTGKMIFNHCPWYR
jgi:hypothetical protein